MQPFGSDERGDMRIELGPKRSIRRVVETRRERRGFVGRALASGLFLGAGMGVAYLLDPVLGRHRRRVVRDKAVHVTHELRDLFSKAARDAANRARGIVAETESALLHEEVSDDVLAERLRSLLGRAVSHPRAIEASVAQGIAVLRGPVFADEVEALLTRVRGVRGIKEIDSQLVAHRDPAGVAGLEGPRRRVRRPGFTNLRAPSVRLLVGLSGGTLTAIGIRRGGLLGTAMSLVGLGAVGRAATNLETKRLFGVGAGRRAVDVQKTITVHAPVEEVFALLREFRNFPRFMSHVREVRVSDGGRRSHWVVEGPAGVPVEWDIEITRQEDNRLLAWRSLPGASVPNAGMAKLEPLPDGKTRVTVRLSYNPPAGAIGHAVAHLFHKDPKAVLDDDLLRLKSLLEVGKARGREGQIKREDLSPPPQSVH
jgi:uncharacterized membrane protein